jgi:hypothetical protein
MACRAPNFIMPNNKQFGHLGGARFGGPKGKVTELID